MSKSQENRIKAKHVAFAVIATPSVLVAGMITIGAMAVALALDFVVYDLPANIRRRISECAPI